MTEASQIIWSEDDLGNLAAFLDRDGKRERVAWAPQPGSQEAFIHCPIFEVLYEGTRGPGKTDALIMDFGQHVGQGYGAEWRGVLFRRTYKELDDVVAKMKEWFPQIWPSATYNEAKFHWEWPDGERLMLRHAKTIDDYWSYHGHAYPWIGWEELTNWPDSALYQKMMSCCRSKRRDMPRKYRATANPYGVGHNWVKARWRLPVPPGCIVGPVIRDSRDRGGNLEPARVAIHGHLLENRVLLHGDPEYLAKLKAAADSVAQYRAWVDGDWDIVAGGMFDDVWTKDVHVVPAIPWGLLPRGWRIDRSYDHGQSKPFSVGWWAESNGEPVKYRGRQYGIVRGDVIRMAEWYGWNGRPNEGVNMLADDIARGIVEREEDWGIRGRVFDGPADSSIFDDYSPGKSVAGDMARPPWRIEWLAADKSGGSRKQGWQQIRKMMRAAYAPMGGGPREEPGLFISERCRQWLRTVPVLTRSEKDMDDVDTNAEDHPADETRYRLRAPNMRAMRRRYR